MYKPPKISSFNFIYKLKKKLEVKKISHAGTLDPLAEGVMVVLTDQDCKIQDQFVKKDKEYEATVLLGASSESFDLEKPLIFEEIPPIYDETLLKRVLEGLTGQISLPVPIFSAKIVGGKRLYKYARKGQELNNLPQMNIHVYLMKLLDTSEYDYFGKRYPLIKVLISCSSGTYIRTLADEIGKRYGSTGVLFHLKRTKVGEFDVRDSKIETFDLL